MTNKEIDEIKRSDEWIKIDYKFSNSTGTIIVKKQLYDKRWKKIKRLFKDVVEIELNDNYRLSIEEIIDMDSEVQYFRRRIRRYNEQIKNATNINDKISLTSIRNSYINDLNGRIKRLKEEYNDRS